jgi:hypothetical protein
MSAAMLGGWLPRPIAREVLGFALAAFAVALFLLNLRRAGEKAERAAECLETRKKNDAFYRQMLEAAGRHPPNRDALAERLRDGRF